MAMLTVKNGQKQGFYRWWGICCGLMLTACTPMQRPPPPELDAVGRGAIGGAVVVGALASTVSGGAALPLTIAVGSVMGGAMGSQLAASQSLLEKVREQGVSVMRVGDEVTLILPTDRFFYPNSPLLQSDYAVVLDIIADYIRSEPNIMVVVAGYTDNQGLQARALALSKQRAQNVVDYLWRHHIDTRFLVAIGHGQENPIASNLTISGRADNRRIEIKMMTIPV